METPLPHPTLAALEDELAHIQASPKQEGRIEWLVRRPATNEREVLQQAKLDETQGLIGDRWHTGTLAKTKDRPLNQDNQLTLMNARVIHAIAQDKNRWALAGDQFYVDFDLSSHNLPPGTQLVLGEAIIEVTAEPHLGCRKFSDRFGKDATAFVNSRENRALNLRGVNAKVVQGGVVRVGDAIKSVSRFND